MTGLLWALAGWQRVGRLGKVDGEAGPAAVLAALLFAIRSHCVLRVGHRTSSTDSLSFFLEAFIAVA